jgi:hypothetical protein
MNALDSFETDFICHGVRHLLNIEFVVCLSIMQVISWSSFLYVVPDNI